MMQRWRLSISVLAVMMMSGIGCGRPDTGANADIAPASSHEKSTAKAGNRRSFSLIDQHGQLVTDQTFRGEWLIVFFGFTHCADFCPTTLFRVSAALKELGEEARNVRVVFITIDPERDTPELLKTYLESFGAGFTGLGGSPQQVAEVTTAFRTYSRKQPAAPDGSYSVDHSTSLYVIDPDGYLSRQLSSDATPQQLAATLRRTITPNSWRTGCSADNRFCQQAR